LHAIVVAGGDSRAWKKFTILDYSYHMFFEAMPNTIKNSEMLWLRQCHTHHLSHWASSTSFISFTTPRCISVRVQTKQNVSTLSWFYRPDPKFIWQ
jgi:hypothetical protein